MCETTCRAASLSDIVLQNGTCSIILNLPCFISQAEEGLCPAAAGSITGAVQAAEAHLDQLEGLCFVLA